MRIGRTIGGAGGVGRGRALVPVTPVPAPLAESQPRPHAGRADAATGPAPAREPANPWLGPLLAQIAAGLIPTIGRTGGPTPSPEARRAYRDALSRPFRLAPGTVLSRLA
jgi:hypothetical protein